jgi:hypothetical protein
VKHTNYELINFVRFWLLNHEMLNLWWKMKLSIHWDILNIMKIVWKTSTLVTLKLVFYKFELCECIKFKASLWFKIDSISTNHSHYLAYVNDFFMVLMNVFFCLSPYLELLHIPFSFIINFQYHKIWIESIHKS